MKTCTKCKQEKDLSLFRVKKNGKLDSWCRPCYSKMSSEHYAKNKESISAFRKTDVYKAMKSEWDLSYRTKNRDELLLKKREYHNKFADKHRANMRNYYQKNKDAYKNRSAKWKKNNRARHNANCMARYTAKMRNRLEWSLELTELACAEAYDKADRLKEITGIDYDVDHIVPLQGKSVSGLHIYSNFQVLPASQNRSKKNLHWPDQWERNK